MAGESLTILGGGNTAFAVAANLALKGVRTTLCELPRFEAAVTPIVDSCEIGLDGVEGCGTATLECVTTDFEEALAANDLLLLIIPAYGHRAFAEACAAFLRPDHTCVLMPGLLGSLEFARVARECGAPEGVTVAETDTAPYVCRKLTPTSAHIWGTVTGLGLGVWPTSESERVQRDLDVFFPGVSLYPHVAACGLAAMNPVVHPAGVVANAGRIEYSRGDFYFYEEGVTPSVARLICAVDRERLAIAAALGAELLPVNTAFHVAGFGPKGDLWATINGSRMLTQLRAPGVIENRWLTEDVPYGIAAWALLSEQLGLPAPTMRALVDVASALLERDFWLEARTPERLGVAEMGKGELVKYLS